MSTENTTFFITRHFDKITSVKNGKHSNCFIQNEIDAFDKIFIKNKNIYLNPFICNDTFERVYQIYKTLDGLQIDMVICSPFLRCIQTALDIVNFTKNNNYINIVDKNIYVDYGLSAIFKDFKLPTSMKQPNKILIDDIYKFSLNFIDNYDYKRNKYPFKKILLFDDTFKELNSSENFSKRFYDTFVKIQNKIKNKNILIVTHGASLTHWYGGTIEKLYKSIKFDYSFIYKIQNLLSKPILLNNDDKKYVKYKQIKNKVKIGLLLLTIDNPYFPEKIKEYLNENTKLYIHAKYPDKLDDYFKKYLIKNLVDTKWGDMSLVNATLNLLENAYDECDYFYLISGDTYIIKKPEIFDLSCFDFIKKYNNIYKSSQWWGLNKEDAKIIIDTRNKYNNYFKDIKLDGAYDENYFLTVLNKEINNYKFLSNNVMYVKWLDNVIAKHPFIFNKLTINNIYTLENSFFIRKCLMTFKYEKNKTKDTLYIFYIGSETNQNEILNLDLVDKDYLLITSIDTNMINEQILKNAFYIVPIIWKFFDNTIQSLKNDPILCSWDILLFFPEKTNYSFVINNFLNDSDKNTYQIKDEFKNITNVFKNDNVYKEWFKKLKQQAKNDYKMFDKINKDFFDKEINNLLTKNKHCKIVINNNIIKEVSLKNERIESIIEIINGVLNMIKIYNLKSIDGTYLFKFSDSCDMDADIPIFCWSKPKNIKSFLFPDFNMHLFDKKKNKFYLKCNIQNKINKIFFKGNSTSQKKTQIREKLNKLSNDKLIVDIDKTSLPYYELCKYKYNLDLPGVYPWSVRLIELYLSNSLPIRVRLYDKKENYDVWIQFYELMFPENESYIDIQCNQNFNNEISDDTVLKIKDEIINNYNYYNKNDDKYHEIVKKNNEKIKYFTMEHIYYYVYQSLKYYKKLII